jgi:hypothetical protein
MGTSKLNLHPKIYPKYIKQYHRVKDNFSCRIPFPCKGDIWSKKKQKTQKQKLPDVIGKTRIKPGYDIL